MFINHFNASLLISRYLLKISDIPRKHFLQVRNLNLNAVRLEGKMMTEAFYDMADMFGILVLPGWACCDAWQHWFAWKSEEYLVAKESLRTQVSFQSFLICQFICLWISLLTGSKVEGTSLHFSFPLFVRSAASSRCRKDVLGCFQRRILAQSRFSISFRSYLKHYWSDWS